MWVGFVKDSEMFLATAGKYGDGWCWLFGMIWCGLFWVWEDEGADVFYLQGGPGLCWWYASFDEAVGVAGEVAEEGEGAFVGWEDAVKAAGNF